MKLLATLGGAVVCWASLAHAGVVDPGLAQELEQAPPGAVISALVYLADHVDLAETSHQLDLQRATRKTRHETVVRALQDKAAATQGGLTIHLQRLLVQGRVERFDNFWIGNIIRVDAEGRELKLLAQRPDVERVYFNHEIELIEPVATGPVDEGGVAGAIETGIEAVRAPEVWACSWRPSTLVSTGRTRPWQADGAAPIPPTPATLSGRGSTP
jgi:hypothetical protein